MASLTDLAGTAQQLVDLYVAELTALGCVLPTDPTTGAIVAYVAPGPVAAEDLPALTINLDSIRPGAAGHPLATWVPPAAWFSYAQWVAMLTRPSAGLSATRPPAWGDVSSDAAQQLSDVELMTRASVNIIAGYKLQAPGVSWVYVGTDPVGPEGGMLVTRSTIQTSLV